MGAIGDSTKNVNKEKKTEDKQDKWWTREQSFHAVDTCRYSYWISFETSSAPFWSVVAFASSQSALPLIGR